MKSKELKDVTQNQMDELCKDLEISIAKWGDKHKITRPICFNLNLSLAARQAVIREWKNAKNYGVETGK